MSDKQPMQATGDGKEGAPDGVNDVKAGSGGESAGGSYANPYGEDTPKQSNPMGHGGQTHINYSGPDGEDQNAPTKDESGGD